MTAAKQALLLKIENYGKLNQSLITLQEEFALECKKKKSNNIDILESEIVTTKEKIVTTLADITKIIESL